MNDESFKLTAEGKANYAKSLPYLLKGVKGTFELDLKLKIWLQIVNHLQWLL